MTTIAILQRPAFDNTDLGNEGLWILANARTLAQYYRAQGEALGEPSTDTKDFDVWLRVQHDLECLLQTCNPVELH